MTKYYGDYTTTDVKTYDDHTVKAEGEGSVAAGGAISGSTVVSGNGNAVGDGIIQGSGNVVGNENNVIQGDGNVAAFGAGAVNNFKADDVTVEDGGALANGGTVSVNNTDNSVEDSHNSASYSKTEDSGNVTTDNSVDGSYNTETESHTETHTTTEDSYNDFAKWVESYTSKIEGSYNEDHHYDA